ncbi:MAG: flagellar biosynthesis anti-sigma factor FlgM [Gammaproteobacteria bacterium]
MKITGTSAPVVATPATPAAAAAPTAAAAPAQASAAPSLESAVLKPAAQALAEMPEIDHARVAELRDALAKGELPFDPARLAGLIERFHGGRG